jgi:hypothetical protein
VLGPEPDVGPYPSDVTARAHEIAAAIEHGPRAGLFVLDGSDEALRAALEHEAMDPSEYQSLVEKYRAGSVALSEVSVRARHPYGSALLQRPAGSTYAMDIAELIRQAGETAAAAAIAIGAVVLDLSSVHLMNLLADDDRLLIRAQLLDLRVARSAVVDALRTREAIRGLTISTFSARLGADGSIERAELTPVQRAMLREQAASLETVTSSLVAVAPQQSIDPTTDAIEVALESCVPLWCDDAAARQRARARGVAAFSLLDLISVLVGRGVAIDEARCRRRLMAQYVVDLPFEGEDLVWLLTQDDWQLGSAQTALVRSQWWSLRSSDWVAHWRLVAEAALLHAPAALKDVTFAALVGAIGAAPAGLATQRYQAIVVQALAACVSVGSPAPPGFLEELAVRGNANVAPRPQFVLGALAQQLETEGVADSLLAAVNLLPGVDLPS